MSDDEEKAEIENQTVVEEEETPEEEQSAASQNITQRLKEKKKEQKKKLRKKLYILAGLSFFGYICWFLFKPFKASAEYAICRTLLELQIPYPHTLYVSELLALRDGSLKLWYTHTDAFGEYRLESFSCKLQPNQETGALEIASLKMHKVYLGPERIRTLNSAMPYFAENPMILNWPTALPDDISALHLDFNSVRRIIIDPTKR